MDIHMGIPTGENHIPILNPIQWVWGIGDPYGDISKEIHMGMGISTGENLYSHSHRNPGSTVSVCSKSGTVRPSTGQMTSDQPVKI